MGNKPNFKAKIQFIEPVVKTEYSEPEFIIFGASWIHIHDKGQMRVTADHERYVVKIRNGQIEFDRPLKFKDDSQQSTNKKGLNNDK